MNQSCKNIFQHILNNVKLNLKIQFDIHLYFLPNFLFLAPSFVLNRKDRIVHRPDLSTGLVGLGLFSIRMADLYIYI